MSNDIVNTLIGRLFREPALLEQLGVDRERVFREAGLTEEQCAVLRDGIPTCRHEGGPVVSSFPECQCR